MNSDRTEKEFGFVWMNVIFLYLLLGVSLEAQNVTTEHSVILNGTSGGGTLTIMNAVASGRSYIMVTNAPSARPQEVFENAAREFKRLGMRHFIRRRGNSLVFNRNSSLGCDNWILGGTDPGFKIPPAPDSLSLRLSDDGKEIFLKWRNPVYYDCISVIAGSGEMIRALPGDVNSVKIPIESIGFFNLSDICFTIKGTKLRTPGNGQSVRLRNRVELESLTCFPFSQGIAPSFLKSGTSSNVQFSEGRLYGHGPGKKPPRPFSCFYQELTGTDDFSGQLWRVFPGLEPEERYSISYSLKVPQPGRRDASEFTTRLHWLNSESITEEELSLRKPADGTMAASISLARPHYWKTVEGFNEEVGSKEFVVPDGMDSMGIQFLFKGSSDKTVNIGFKDLKITRLTNEVATVSDSPAEVPEAETSPVSDEKGPWRILVAIGLFLLFLLLLLFVLRRRKAS